MHTADYIECPYCNYKEGNYHDYIEVGDCAGSFDMDCPKCKKEFTVSDFYSIFWFETKKK